MFITVRVALVGALAFAAMGLVASGGGRMLSPLHVRAECTSQVVTADNVLATCHKGWWKPAPNLSSLGCLQIGANVWSCPAGVKP
jgi:hypothetical protein